MPKKPLGLILIVLYCKFEILWSQARASMGLNYKDSIFNGLGLGSGLKVE